ncbi:hypothetical protein D3C87_2143040 [compost metagenome]
MARQGHGFGQGAQAGSRHELFGGDAGFDHRLEHIAALVQRKGIGLTRRAEHGNAMAAILEQLPAVS